MSIVLEDVYSYKDPDPVVPYGVALMDYGLTAGDALDGYGLVSHGLLWQLYQIWLDNQFYWPLVTAWINGNSVITTNWANDNPVVTTTWENQPNYNGF